MNLIFILASFLIPFFTYLLTLAPTITYGDNPELIAAAYSLGVPHPPGYPPFCLLGKLFSLIPAGDIAFRINLMSAVFGAAAVAVIFLILKELLNDNLVSLAAALVLAFSRVFWLFSIQAEVFALNNLLLALVIYFTLKKNWRLTLLFLGLGLANQQNIILVSPALIFFYWTEIKKSKINLLRMMEAFLYLAAGIFLYSYLLVAASFNPPVNTGNPDNLINLFKMITRDYYPRSTPGMLTRNFLVSIPLWPLYLGYYLNELSKDFGRPVFILVLIGLWHQARTERRLFKFFLTAWFFIAPAMIFMSYPVLNSFYRQITERLLLGASLAVTVWIGFGLKMLGKFTPGRLKYGLLILPVFVFGLNFNKCNLSGFFYGHDLGKNIFKSLAREAVVFSLTDDPYFHLLYFQTVEKLRPDVVLLFRRPNDPQLKLYHKNLPNINFSNSLENRKYFSLPETFPLVDDFLIKIIFNSYLQHPIYSTDPVEYFSKNQLPMGITVRLYDTGHLNRIKNNPQEAANYQRLEKAIWQSYQRRGIYDLTGAAPFKKNLIRVYQAAGDFKKTSAEQRLNNKVF